MFNCRLCVARSINEDTEDFHLLVIFEVSAICQLKTLFTIDPVHWLVAHDVEAVVANLKAPMYKLFMKFPTHSSLFLVVVTHKDPVIRPDHRRKVPELVEGLRPAD